MSSKTPGVKSGGKSNRALPSGNGVGNASNGREVARLARIIEELERRVTQNSRDLDTQFHRIAELQAVVDRMQMASNRRRGRHDDTQE